MELHRTNLKSARALGASLAALTVALPLLLALLAPAYTAALAPLALVLPFVTMGLLEAVATRPSAPKQQRRVRQARSTSQPSPRAPAAAA